MTTAFNFKSGQLGWKSPSNIAIVKYWGKHGNQLPNNPSLSFTLSQCHTTTRFEFDLNESRKQFELQFKFEGKESPAFEKRIRQFFEQNEVEFPYLNHLSVSIESSNSFPHSAGIASSASAMSALALCICSMETRIIGPFENQFHFRTRASHLARLASGSAARSVFGGLVCWGLSESVSNSSDEYAVPINEDIDPIFTTYKDTIVVVDSSEKKVSSSAGHGLMKNHPYAEMRYYVARNHVDQLKDIMQAGDVEAFGKILENEALSLHGLMMNSDPSFILMAPETLKAIELVREFRADTRLPLYFTLDAGPNLHLLYPASFEEPITKFVKSYMLPMSANGLIIYDEVGNGPQAVGHEDDRNQ